MGYLRREIFGVIGKPRFVTFSDCEETYIYKDKIDLIFLRGEPTNRSIAEDSFHNNMAIVALPYSHKDTFRRLMELKKTLEN